MKKIIYYFCMLLPPVFVFAACEDRVMDKTDLGSETADAIWENPAYIEGFVDYCMFGGPNDNHDNKGIPEAERGLKSHTEESFGSTKAIYDDYQVASPDAGLWWENIDRWSYTNIRNINMFLGNRENFTAQLPEKNKQDYIGQMLTLRAWLYFDMVRVYGGVPLILHAQRSDEELGVPRSKTSECIEQIIKDLDEAIAIPDEYFPVVKRDEANFGRISKAVALALKGRILLTYASPQFSSRTPAGTKSAEERWNEAYAACKEAKDRLSAAGYGLFRPNPATPAEATRNFLDMFSEENEMNAEMVWVRRYKANVKNNSVNRNYRPGTSGGNNYSPTVELANAFGNADGTPYTGLTVDYAKDAGRSLGDVTQPGNSPGDGITNVAFWQNREPRFYATVAWNGSYWPLVRLEQNELEEDVVDGKLQHQWILKQVAAQNPFDQADLASDNRGEGLLVRKFADETRDYSRVNEQCGADWPLIRYAEVLLNFAEAAAMTGHTSEAYDALDAVRKRAGIPQGANFYGLGRNTGKALIADIMHERAIELAFESFRFYDVRRWRQFTEDLVPGKTSLYGSKVNGLRRHTLKAALKEAGASGSKDAKVAAASAIVALGNLEDSQAAVDKYFELFYHEIMLYDSEAFRYNPEREDFFRIPYSHIMSNPAIAQTAGWTDDRGPGTFDPYE